MLGRCLGDNRNEINRFGEEKAHILEFELEHTLMLTISHKKIL
jgi:hypothetical protein